MSTSQLVWRWLESKAVGYRFTSPVVQRELERERDISGVSAALCFFREKGILSSYRIRGEKALLWQYDGGELDVRFHHTPFAPRKLVTQRAHSHHRRPPSPELEVDYGPIERRIVGHVASGVSQQSPRERLDKVGELLQVARLDLLRAFTEVELLNELLRRKTDD